ncbi:hypothetical protein [Enterococcus sp. DIV0240a]|uniref:hypothetical protein n=1 Tax=unclassified Enterococcus TaxID=2608891 RepID=UPI003D2A55E9
MKNYWYVSLSNRYPQPSEQDPVRSVQSVQVKKDYSIVEMSREATPNEIDHCKLVECGYGGFDDEHVQENIKKHTR